MSLTDTTLLAALQAVTDPNTGKDFVTTKALQNLQIQGGDVSFDLEMGYPARSQHPALRQALITAAKGVSGVGNVSVNITTRVIAHAAQRGVQLLPQVRNIIAVASGKGGVGKSTTAANLALALAAEGARVGLLDADIYGPSQPTMLGLAGERPESEDGKTMQPLQAHGVKVMSIGFLVPADNAMIWRGPMATNALEQMLRQTAWGDLDYLIVDMPPGTGDAQLTMAQRVALTGAVIVSTPQDIALIDARRGVKMFEKTNVPVLGVVENMSFFCCPNCGHRSEIFGHGGARAEADKLGIEFLGEIPLLLDIRSAADAGTPIVASAPQSDAARAYRDVAARLQAKLDGKLGQPGGPRIVIS